MILSLGAHLSISGGYSKALDNIKKIGGNCLQIFSSSPRSWKLPQLKDEEIKNFIDLKTRLKINPVYFHSSYLINLADNKQVGYLSKQFLINELNLAGRLQIRGSIVHLGSFKEKSSPSLFSFKEKYKTLVDNIKEILNRTLKNTYFIIENAGTRKIGKTLNEIAQIVKDVNNKRVKICLDTCHLQAAGYDISTGSELGRFLEKFDQKIGLPKLELWHLNDSRDPFGSFRDRHENIGQGTIPLNTFKLLVNQPKLRKSPFIIETPGFDKKGPDKRNLDIVKSLARDY